MSTFSTLLLNIGSTYHAKYLTFSSLTVIFFGQLSYTCCYIFIVDSIVQKIRRCKKNIRIADLHFFFFLEMLPGMSKLYKLYVVFAD